MRRIGLVVALALTAALVGLLATGRIRVQPRVGASAPELPELESAVHDPEGAFGLLHETLEQFARDWREDLGIEVVVAAVRPTDEPLVRVAERWIETHRIGEDAPTGGMLVLMEPAGRRARIAVTYGLEGVLPDALLGEIADDQLAPYASWGTPAMAVHDVMDFLQVMLLEKVLDGELELAERFRERPAVRETLAFLSGGAGAQVRIPARPDDGWKGPVPPERVPLYAPSPDPEKSFAAYMRTLADLVGDPELELFTPGSRFQRRRSPLAPYETLRRAEAFRRSRPYYVIVEGDRAVVRSEDPSRNMYPVFLHRIDGLWRVDLVELWKNIFFDDGHPFVYNRNHPYAFGLEGIREARTWDRLHAEDDAVGPLEVDEEAEAARLEARIDAGGADAHDHLALAELLFRNGWCWELALGHYDAATKLAPEDAHVLSTAADRALYIHLYDAAVPWLEELGKAGYERLGWAHARAGRHDAAIAAYRRAVAENPFSTRPRRVLAWLIEEASGG